jgi:alcohol dehydrogenase class IV
VHKKLHELGLAAGVCSKEDSDAAAADKFINAILKLNAAMQIPETLSGIRTEDIPLMARHAAKEANPLYPVPVLMDAKELELFYYQVADGITPRKVLSATRLETAS